MTELTSLDNKIVKLVCGLNEKKYRDREGCYIAEGPNLVREALSCGNRVRFIFIRALSASPEVLQIAEAAEDEGLAVYECSDAVFAKMSKALTPQGILAVLSKKEQSSEAFFSACKNRNVLVLDRIQDPGNMGTLIRTAEAMGFGGAVIMKGCQDPYSPKVVRACAGSLERLPLLQQESSAECIDMLKERGVKLYVSAMEGGRESYLCDLSERCAIVVGNEGNGVAEEFKAASDQIICIPMAGNTESLNAALAGGMLMYEAMRQTKTKEG